MINEGNTGEWLYDENGRMYRLVHKTRQKPRKTFVKGHIDGKYWGEKDNRTTNEFQQSEFFNYNIYEATLTGYSFRKESEGHFPDAFAGPGDHLIFPQILKARMVRDEKTYEINIRDVVLTNVQIDRKRHQRDGNEVFGAISADITGYLLDYLTEYYAEREYKEDPEPVIIPDSGRLSGTLTGDSQRSGEYHRDRYYDFKSNKEYWGNWVFDKPLSEDLGGCFSFFFKIFLGILAIAFFLMLLPELIFIVPIILILFFLWLIPAWIYKWLFRLFAFFILLFFLSQFLKILSTQRRQILPQPTPRPVVDDPVPVDTATAWPPPVDEPSPVIDTVSQIERDKSFITHYLRWRNYEGEIFEGTIKIRRNDYASARNYKMTEAPVIYNKEGYDAMLFSLRNHDRNLLEGVYSLFDSIEAKKHFSQIQFAKMLVSFVQYIPYTLILKDSCDPNLYDDEYIHNYLLQSGARCEGNQMFGLNSPVEFMATLNGDCDTRTLFLFTIFAHYGYDVAVMSSDYYTHSILGINLPIQGTSYLYGQQRYVLWETTAVGHLPGVLPSEIRNLNYWRISIKSK